MAEPPFNIEDAVITTLDASDLVAQSAVIVPATDINRITLTNTDGSEYASFEMVNGRWREVEVMSEITNDDLADHAAEAMEAGR